MGVAFSQTRVPASSPLERDPRYLPRAQIYNRTLMMGADASNVAAFWAAIDNMGDYQTADPTTATRTVLNVASGRGVLYGLVGPIQGTAGAVTTWTVTVDGVPCTILAGGGASLYRSVIGSIFESGDRYTTADATGGYGATAAGVFARTSNDVAFTSNAGPNQQITLPHKAKRFITFDTSLNITVALSGALGIDPLPAYAGAIWSAVL